MDLSTILDELEKLGAVSHEEASAALDRLDTLERNKPTITQVARYGGLGAATGVGVSALRNVIKGNHHGGLRGIAADATAGALTTGAVPLLRAHLDRKAESGVLEKYLTEQNAPPANLQKVAWAKLWMKLAMMLPPPTAAATAIGGALTSGASHAATAAKGQVLRQAFPTAASTPLRSALAGGAHQVAPVMPAKGVDIAGQLKSVPNRAVSAHNRLLEQAVQSNSFEGMPHGTAPSMLPKPMQAGRTVAPAPVQGGRAYSMPPQATPPPRYQAAEGATGAPSMPPPPKVPGQLGQVRPTAATMPAPASIQAFSNAATLRPAAVPQF